MKLRGKFYDSVMRIGERIAEDNNKVEKTERLVFRAEVQYLEKKLDLWTIDVVAKLSENATMVRGLCTDNSFNEQEKAKDFLDYFADLI